jgi:acyl-CoA thioesterase
MKDQERAALTLDRAGEILESIPYAKLLGMEVEHAQAGVATLAFEVRDDLRRNNGIVHGGAIASLIDTATAFAIISLLPAGEQTATVDLTITYLRPLSAGRATATARVIRAGRRLISLSAEASDHSGKLIATALSTYIRI